MQARTPGSLGPPEGATGNGKTAQSYIAGIGASGALLAGAVVTFVFLVGTVSFDVWPAASNTGSGTDSLGVAELSGDGDGSANASLGTTVALIADSVPTPDAPPQPAAPKADGGLTGGGGGTDDGPGGTGGDTGDGDTPGNTGDGGTVGGEPGGDPGPGNGGENDESDRPTSHRPDRDDGDSPGSTSGGGSTPTPPGSNEPSDRPGGGGGRG